MGNLSPNPSFKLVTIEKWDKKYSIWCINPKIVNKFVSHIVMIILQLRKPEKFLLILVKKESRIVIANRNINCELSLPIFYY